MRIIVDLDGVVVKSSEGKYAQIGRENHTSANDTYTKWMVEDLKVDTINPMVGHMLSSVPKFDILTNRNPYTMRPLKRVFEEVGISWSKVDRLWTCEGLKSEVIPHVDHEGCLYLEDVEKYVQQFRSHGGAAVKMNPFE